MDEKNKQLPLTLPLTFREEQIAILITQRLTNRQIADVLDLPPISVRVYIIDILRKANVKDETELVSKIILQESLDGRQIGEVWFTSDTIS